MNMKNRGFLFISAILITLSIRAALAEDELVHVLKKGETLYSLSKTYNAPLALIMSLNGIDDPSRVKAGEKLRIPQGEIYAVKKGDTLYSIAKNNGVKLEDLLRANNLTSSSTLKIGDSLYIPKTDSAPKTENPVSGSKAAADSHKALKNQDASRASVPAAGDVLWPVKGVELAYLTGKIYGVLITADKGAPVESISSGTVISAGPFRGFGKVVFIRSDAGFIYVYGGIDELYLKNGDRLNFGGKIGTLGFDPIAGKSQLYFMVYNNDSPIDPATAPRG